MAAKPRENVVQKKINKESGICENFMRPTCILYDIYLNIKINLNKYYCLLNNKTKILLVSFREVSFLNQRHFDEKCRPYNNYAHCLVFSRILYELKVCLFSIMEL